MEGGIDEAGRGPVLGPLVVAGVAAEATHVASLGVKDSKLLSPGRREHLDRILRRDPGVHVEVRVVQPAQLDEEMGFRNLNRVELARFQDIARRLHERGASPITVDAADVDAARFGRAVAEGLPPEAAIVSTHQAERHPCVAAASIIAKVERDRVVAVLARGLERRLGMEMGSGYPSDPRTQAFLAAWVARFGDVPEGTRRRWATTRALLAPAQATLDVAGVPDAGGAAAQVPRASPMGP